MPEAQLLAGRIAAAAGGGGFGQPVLTGGRGYRRICGLQMGAAVRVGPEAGALAHCRVVLLGLITRVCQSEEAVT